MITRVEIENVKAIEKLAMDFTSRLTVIVGPNESGKTSILSSMHSLLDYRNEFFSRARPFSGATNKSIIQIQTSSGAMKRDLIHFISVEDEPDPSERSFYLKINSDLVGEPSELDQFENGVLLPNGSNLTSLLVLLRLNAPEKFDEIQDSLKRIIPTVTRIVINRSQRTHEEREVVEIDGTEYPHVTKRPITIERILFDTVNKSGIEASAMSEGTLVVLSVLSALVNSPANAVVLLDDIDASLHPAAQSKLIATIRRLFESRPELQVIATTHSPYLLDSLTHDEIRLTTLDDQGRVVSGTLMDHPDFERWKDEMTPGEMWSMFGEKWLTEKAEKTDNEPLAEVTT